MGNKSAYPDPASGSESNFGTCTHLDMFQ